ncbi:tetratricopeptide repeat protein [Algisphaera agarilytica]|uniref:Flp pilus assembly protein TadD n=1 Tax=Algisphaera agarilytica TaxID=1385975 RepID=A0A7X0LJL8_9BACT|nr:hypothetical protein [Algisphaera agarilytica]MBB6428746.1 Flp pilus assembly protein TadD [Algisphaera agarilytica]
MGKAWQRLGNDDRRFDAYIKSHQLNPTHPDVAREAGIAAMDIRKPDLAVAVTKRAVIASPEDAGLKANLALAYLFCGQSQEAMTVVTESLQMDPEDQITLRLVRS